MRTTRQHDPRVGKTQASALDTITKSIQSPPRSFVAGVVLFGVVWGFFKGVESVLADETSLSGCWA
jgi:hypothetical protein